MSEIVGHIQKVERLQNAVKQMDDAMDKIKKTLARPVCLTTRKTSAGGRR